MTRGLSGRIKRTVGDESGFALVVALGFMVVLGIVGASAVAYSSTNSGRATRSRADQSAYALAEAGINNAAAVLSLPSNNAFDPTLLPPRTATYAGGTVTWSGTLDQTTGVWTLTATGRTRNPTGPHVRDVLRTLNARLAVSPSWTGPLNNIAWNYIWATHTGSPCDMTIGQSVTVAAPLYVQGNLCLQNTATISGGPLAVKGQLTLSQKANGVGLPNAPVNEAHIGAGCLYWNRRDPDVPCKGSPDNVYANVLDANVPALTPPTVNWDKWYLNSNPGPYYPCTTQSGPVSVFENETVSLASPDPTRRNNSVLGVFDLTPSGSYTCKTDAGELSWDAAQHLLTVHGTVFIDGSAVADNGAVNRYQGQGSLFLSGTMLIKNTKLCAVVNSAGSDCDTPNWDPNKVLLFIAANGDGGQVPTGDSIQLVSSTFQGALFATGAIENDTTSQGIGPMIGSTVILGQSVTTSFPSVTIVPIGMEANPTMYAQPGSPIGYSG